MIGWRIDLKYRMCIVCTEWLCEWVSLELYKTGRTAHAPERKAQ